MLQHYRKRSSKQLRDGSKCLKRVWKHKFFCLTHVDQFCVPTNEAEKDKLFDAGLGEKEIEFEDLNLSAEGFKEIILQSFPQLRDAGGYQMCKCLPNSRRLEPGNTEDYTSNPIPTSLFLIERVSKICCQSTGNSLERITKMKNDVGTES